MARSIDDLHEVATGPCGRVVLTPQGRKLLSEATEKQRVRFQEYARIAVNYGFNQMPEEHFTFEGRFRVSRPGGQPIAIYAFKPWKLRIYGGLVHAEGKMVFIGTEVVEKKQSKADRDALKRAANRLEEFL